MIFFQVLAAILIAIALANLYFVEHGYRAWRAVPESRLLLLLFVLKVMATSVGLALAYVAGAFLIGVRPIPGGGIILTVAALVLVCIPAVIHLTVRSIENS